MSRFVLWLAVTVTAAFLVVVSAWVAMARRRPVATEPDSADSALTSPLEGAEWLGGTGWQFTGHLPLAGPITLVMAVAV